MTKSLLLRIISPKLCILFRHCYEKKESIQESKKDVNELISTLSDIFLCDFVDLVESRNY